MTNRLEASSVSHRGGHLELQAKIASLVEHACDTKLLDGLALGVIADGESHIYTTGEGITGTTSFEIGSITKTFTAELLRRLVDRGVFRWNDPVAMYMPVELNRSGTTVASATDITLLDLATHRSGLALHPTNLKIVNHHNPYGAYSAADMEQYVATVGLEKPPDCGTVYSNIGYVILGYVIERATGAKYADLLEEYILEPLGLRQTSLALPGTTEPRLIQGHSQSGRATPAWTQDAFAPAGALRSTCADQLKWASYLLDAASLKAQQGGVDAETQVGWSRNPNSHFHFRDGMTSGFCSYLGMQVEDRCALVLLANRKSPQYLGALARNCERLVRDLPPLPFSGDYGRKKAALLELLRGGKKRAYAVGVLRHSSLAVYVSRKIREGLERP